MPMKSLLVDIVDGRLVLPEEALALLPARTPLRMIVDTGRGTVCVFAKDPMALSPQTEQLMEALAELDDGLTWDEYSAPVAEDLLRKRKLSGGESEK